MNNKQRPVFLDVTKYRYPIPAIISILHRISGVVLFLAIPLLLWALQASLASPEHFQALQAVLDRPLVITCLWLTLAALFFHLVAGIRHLLMDIGVGESLREGRRTAYAVIVITLALLLVAGIWL